MADLKTIGERHRPVPEFPKSERMVCLRDRQYWPCDTAVAVDRNRQLEMLAMEWDGFAEMAYPLAAHQRHRFERCVEARKAIGALAFWKGDGTDDAAD